MDDYSAGKHRTKKFVDRTSPMNMKHINNIFLRFLTGKMRPVPLWKLLEF
jgi:hypothetical protein